MRTALTQSILIDDSGQGSSAQVCRAVANASAAAFTDRIGGSKLWSSWMFHSSYAKLVRTPQTGASLLRALENEHRSYRCGPVMAHAFAPMSREQMPPDIASARVSGLQRPDVTSHWDTKIPQGKPLFLVANDLGMSAGKQAAQVAHALVLLADVMPTVDDQWFMAPGSSHALASLEQTGSSFIAVHDAGRSEIPPNSLTVIVTSMRG